MPRPEPKLSSKPRAAREPVERVAGLAAARAVLTVRPKDVLHIAYAPEARTQLSELLRSAAKHRIAYREMAAEELAKVAATVHHEGISMQVRARPPHSLSDVIAALSAGGFMLALDGVQNPHNIGALLRSAAYFGARSVLIGGGDERLLTPAAVRIAEGGAEYVRVCFAADLSDALERLGQAGARILGADAHSGERLERVRLSGKSVLVLGNERTGLSAAVRRRCMGLLRIAGSGQVESLNVSVAAGILMAHAATERGTDE